ncbi:MAG: ParB N-terminal domain-containing protein [Alphaproteobacteria bacterium]|nr:ParB N-terminal domain-containing protein [Alphaproteobacteria bacterium]
MDVKQIPVTELIPYSNNSRTHSDVQVAQIAASIKEFGFNNPILLDGAKGIIAGHGRLLAARKLGMDDVPCIELAHLSDTQRKAYILADNKLALNAGWDIELLSLEMGDLRDGGFDLSIVGFGPDELEMIFPTPIDEYPDLPDGDRQPYQQMTFTLHDEQVDYVQAAIDAAKGMGEFVNSPNENSNGNAIARVCEMFVGSHGNG